MQNSILSTEDSIRTELAKREKRQFCKQSCTKIQQGLEDMPYNCSSRAIWELIQNARDQAKDENGDKDCIIKIVLTRDEFIFAHQGKAFDYDSLGSLVKQVSSQSKENDDTVGQYGTGFITTHVFGRKILINGSLNVSEFYNDRYVNIDKFEIDRTFNSTDEFVDKMANQLVRIDDLVVSQFFAPQRKWTELRYQLNSAHNAYNKALEALKNAILLMPYVMTFNEKIREVSIFNDITGEKYIFTKTELLQENDVNIMRIQIDTLDGVQYQNIYFLSSQDKKDIIILPLKDLYTTKSLKDFPKLFVYFPLLGTEKFGMDVIFHSSRFFPVEKRNGIHLPQENANVKSKYEANVQVLSDLRDMVFEYYRRHCNDISGWENVLNLSFECDCNSEEETNEFFKFYKESWTSFYETLPLFHIDGELKSLNSGYVNLLDDNFIDTLDENDRTWLDSIYSTLHTIWCIPQKEMIIQWSKVVSSWESKLNYKVSIKDSAEHIENMLKANNINLQQVYDFDVFLTQTKNKGFFRDFALIPNREGVLIKNIDLKDAFTITPELYNIAKALLPDLSAKFVDNKFRELDDFETFTRNELKSVINEELSILKSETYCDKEKPNRCDEEILSILIDLSSIQYSKFSENRRKKVMPIICRYYGKTYNEIMLEKLDPNEYDLSERPFEHLIENVLLDISFKDKEWLITNRDFLFDLLSGLSYWSEFYNKNNGEGMVKRYKVFPNKSGYLCKAEELYKGDIDQRLMELNLYILEKDLNDELVDSDFDGLYDFKEIKAESIANNIEDRMEEAEFKSKYVLDIINYIDESPKWGKWFPKIANQKADIFMKQVKPECKDSIYQLMKVEDPEKLAQLADIVQVPNLEKLLKLAQQELMKKLNDEARFKFKESLGIYVENAIQKKLSSFFKQNIPGILKVENCQYGQDLIVSYNNEPVYFIEVKSRWISNSPVNMSRSQMFESVEESDRYALCYVDMSNNKISSSGIHQYPEFSLLKDNIRFIDNIGSLNKECIDSVRCSEEKVYIGGDYKCVVPHKVIKENGLMIDEFLERMVSKIKDQIDDDSCNYRMAI